MKTLKIKFSSDSQFPSNGGVSEGRGGSSMGASFENSSFKSLFIIISLFLTTSTFAQTNFHWEWFATGKYSGMYSKITDIVCDDSGNVYGIGTSTGKQIFGNDTINTLGNDDVIVFKYDSSGNAKWGKLLSSASWEQGYSIVLDSKGDIFICGGFHDSTYIDDIKLKSNGWYDIFLAKLNNAGEAIWAKNYGSASQDRGVKLAIDSQDNIYMLGYAYCVSGSTSITIDNQTVNLTCGEMFLAKFNSSGNCLWNKRVGGRGMEGASSQTIRIFNDSLIYVAGFYEKNFTLGNYAFKTSDYVSNAFFAVFRDNGTLKFAKAMGNENSATGFLGLDIDKKGNLNLNIIATSESLIIDDNLYINNPLTTKSVLFVFDSLYNIMGNHTTLNIAGKFTFDNEGNIISAGGVGQNPIIVWDDTLYKETHSVCRYLLKQGPDGKVKTSYFITCNNLYMDMTKILYNNGNIYMCGNLNVGSIGESFIDLDSLHITSRGWFLTKIKQIDSTTVGIDNGEWRMNNEELSIYPNPANDRLYIKTTSSARQLNGKVYDVYGKLLIDNSELRINNGVGVINIERLNSGIYFIKVNGVTKRFVKL